MNREDLIDGLHVIARRRGQKIQQGDVELVEAAIKALAKRADARRKPEVRLNDDKTLDEVVTGDFQLEQMDYNHWFLCVGGGDKGVAVWLYSKSKISATYEWRDLNTPVSPQRESQP